ncbi:DNA-3-methyladenine glycosylase II [hydrothermal vent metagenome]|uniref:DNA-3-methyladenine glycosylase II n=1 Tax=hydrothermal vent metagenome TaxID=652676 RepID=A0A3B0X6Y6_9ZZZZ
MNIEMLDAATHHLQKTDKIMGEIINQCGPIFRNKTRPPYYHALVSAIISQQLSLKAAQTIEKRLLDIQGGRYFTADKILNLKTTLISRCGISKNKVRYITTLARAVSNGDLNFRALSRKDDDAVRKELVDYPGIGPWSADIFLITSLGRMDVFPVGDLIIRKSMQKNYQLADDVAHSRYISIAEIWRPYRTVACFYLWKSFH